MYLATHMERLKGVAAPVALAKPEAARPLAPQGGRGAKGRARRQKDSPKIKRVDSGVSHQVKQAS